mmetsp:Transcript_14730/g.40996  ORF Transcript_14730/g.40996 Transcript_14730/m.40996 type:complete len:156 (-) Transcript_14730:1725-2192(-)
MYVPMPPRMHVQDVSTNVSKSKSPCFGENQYSYQPYRNETKPNQIIKSLGRDGSIDSWIENLVIISLELCKYRRYTCMHSCFEIKKVQFLQTDTQSSRQAVGDHGQNQRVGTSGNPWLRSHLHSLAGTVEQQVQVIGFHDVVARRISILIGAREK